VPGDITAYWTAYYDRVHHDGRPWLDYSNERVQAQSFALALEAAGPVSGRRCLDVGSGQGQFPKVLLALGATRVTAVELVAATVERCRAEAPAIDWRAGDAAAPASYEGLGTFEVVTALEVLQYVPFEATVGRLFSLVEPGGRLVGIVPNRACPLVSRPIERFEGRYGAALAADVTRTLAALPGVSQWTYRGLHFGKDQRVAPYAPSAWTTATDWAEAPNRFLFVATRP